VPPCLPLETVNEEEGIPMTKVAREPWENVSSRVGVAYR
jgi:hypothetical protein